ncbi:MAG: DUF2093 domain-containing protein [Pseudomonadota bacterium]
MLTKRPPPPGMARVKYLDGDLQVVEPGDFVLCAVTDRKIPLQALRYWSVDLQEAYIDADAAGQRMAGRSAAD